MFLFFTLLSFIWTYSYLRFVFVNFFTMFFILNFCFLASSCTLLVVAPPTRDPPDIRLSRFSAGGYSAGGDNPAFFISDIGPDAVLVPDMNAGYQAGYLFEKAGRISGRMCSSQKIFFCCKTLKWRCLF